MFTFTLTYQNECSLLQTYKANVFMSNNVRKHLLTRAHNKDISVCAFAQSDQFLLSAWRDFASLLSKMRPVKILIRLCECTGWSESQLGAHVRRYIFWCCGSYLVLIMDSRSIYTVSFFPLQNRFMLSWKNKQTILKQILSAVCRDLKLSAILQLSKAMSIF